MILNKSVPLRVPPDWINQDSNKGLKKKILLQKTTTKKIPDVRLKLFRDVPEKFSDPQYLHDSLKETTWAIEYIDFFVNAGGYQIVSSAAGRINGILLTIFPPSDGIQIQTHVYKTLIKHLGSNRTYFILCPVNLEKTISKWFGKDVEVHFYFSVFDVTCWAQDPFVALYSQNYANTILAESNDFNRADDQTIACDVGAQSKKIINLPSYYYLQGGNILSTLDYVMIGKDYVAKNTGRAFLGSEPEVLKAFSELFNRKKCISVGLPEAIPSEHRRPKDSGSCVTELSFSGIWQPIYHIDMFLTPTGKKTDKKEILLVGSLTEAKKAIGQVDSSEMDRFNKHCASHAQYFDGIAKQLEAYFEVILIPVYPGIARFMHAGDTYETHYYLTYNNVVVESFEDLKGVIRQNVYMPTFTLTAKDDRLDLNPRTNKELNEIRRKLDTYAKNIWEKLGFKVYPISRMESFAQSGGSIHCMTKILERTTHNYIQN